MIKNHYFKSLLWIERNRFRLLLFATLLVIILPSFFGGGPVSEFVFIGSLSFLFLQSMAAANVKKSRKNVLRIVVVSIIFITWLRPLGFDANYLEIIKLFFFVFFFLFVIIHLFKFIRKSGRVDADVLITSVNIYFLIGIVGASLCQVMHSLLPDAYNFPSYIQYPNFAHFLYYSFITMSTVGYGDITPHIPQTMTMAYILSIIGQLYVAIILAFMIGKFLMQKDQKREEKNSEEPIKQQ